MYSKGSGEHCHAWADFSIADSSNHITRRLVIQDRRDFWANMLIAADKLV